MKEKLLLIDGNSIANRAFYGVPDLTNANGLHTNAIYGFLSIMFRFLEEEKPDYLAIAFDVHAPTFRHEIFKDYKGTRHGMPEELKQQFPVLKEVLAAMNILLVEQAGLEADDILGTWANRAEEKGMDVSLVSGDRDLLQIASDQIKIRIPKTRKGITTVEDYYAKDLMELDGITPAQVIEMKALMGDSADNIPGVPKVGKVTAKKLIDEYQTMENVYAHLDEITKPALHKNLAENEDLAKLSKVLATIEVNADIDFDVEAARHENIFTKEAYALYKQLGFKKFLPLFEGGLEESEEEKFEFEIVNDLSKADEVFKQAKESEVVSFYCESLGYSNAPFTGIALTLSKEQTFYIEANGFLTEVYIWDQMASITKVRKENRSFVGFGIKKYYEKLKAVNDLAFFDVQIAAYLLNPLISDYKPENISNEYLKRMMPDREELLGKNDKEATSEKQMEYAAYASNTIYLSFLVLEEALKKDSEYKLFNEIEMPTSYVLYEMEREGIAVKREELKAYSLALDARISELEESIYKDAGKEFNINSPKQLGIVLFEDLEIKGGKKTKTGYSTAADVLDRLAPDYPIIQNVQEYRGLAKLKSTYAEGLANYISDDERIHTTFNQTTTATGRLSSTDPNLQNIPIRMELGRKIRKVFVPKEGYVFVDADYSQIELRILAHMSEDEMLIRAYNENQDIHALTASQVFNVPIEEVTPLQRRNAKAVNFGIVYGISSFGLSQDLSITVKEAKQYIEEYFKTYPKIKEFLDRLVSDAKEKGYSETCFNRKRPVPELKNSNFMRRSFGERVAMNAPIQGTAADVMKLASIDVSNELKKQGLESKLILQIHDELLIEAKIEEVEAVKQLLEDKMKHAAKFAVELEVDVHTGENWYDAK